MKAARTLFPFHGGEMQVEKEITPPPTEGSLTVDDATEEGENRSGTEPRTSFFNDTETFGSTWNGVLNDQDGNIDQVVDFSQVDSLDRVISPRDWQYDSGIRLAVKNSSSGDYFSHAEEVYSMRYVKDGETVKTIEDIGLVGEYQDQFEYLILHRTGTFAEYGDGDWEIYYDTTGDGSENFKVDFTLQNVKQIPGGLEATDFPDQSFKVSNRSAQIQASLTNTYDSKQIQDRSVELNLVGQEREFSLTENIDALAAGETVELSFDVPGEITTSGIYDAEFKYASGTAEITAEPGQAEKVEISGFGELERPQDAGSLRYRNVILKDQYGNPADEGAIR